MPAVSEKPDKQKAEQKEQAGVLKTVARRKVSAVLRTPKPIKEPPKTVLLTGVKPICIKHSGQEERCDTRYLYQRREAERECS